MMVHTYVDYYVRSTVNMSFDKPHFVLLKVWQRPYAQVPLQHQPPIIPPCHEITQSTSYPDLRNHHSTPPPPNGGVGDDIHNAREQYEELSCPACILQVTHGLNAP